MVRRRPAAFENLQRPARLRRLLGQKILQHLPRDQARTAAHRENAARLQELERLDKQLAIAAHRFLDRGVAAGELGRIEDNDAEMLAGEEAMRGYRQLLVQALKLL